MERSVVPDKRVLHVTEMGHNNMLLFKWDRLPNPPSLHLSDRKAYFSSFLHTLIDYEA